MSLTNLLTAKDRILVGAESRFTDSVKVVERDLLERILQALAGADRSGGRFDPDSPENQELLMRLGREVERRLQSNAMARPVDRYLTAFRDLDDVNAQIFTITGDIKLNAAAQLIGQVRAGMIDGVITKIATPKNIGSQVAPLIRQVAYKHILLGTTYKQAETEFRALLGQSGQTGILERYTTQIVRDTLNQYDGVVQMKLTKELDFNAFMFAGSIIETSRPACIHMVNAPNAVTICKGRGKSRVCQLERNRFADIVLPDGGFLIEDIPKIINRNQNESGWISDTTADTYFENRNGYNCRHQVVPFYKRDAKRIADAIPKS